jgi:hypothetical protein
MKKLNISEGEKKYILDLHNSLLLNEQDKTTEILNFKLKDIQNLVGLTGNQADNILGPITYNLIDKAIDNKIQAKSKVSSVQPQPELKPESKPETKQLPVEKQKVDTTIKPSSSDYTKSDTERLKNIGVDSSGRVTDKFGTKPPGI